MAACLVAVMLTCAGRTAQAEAQDNPGDAPGAERQEPPPPTTITVIGRKENDAESRRLESPTPVIEMPQERVQRLGMIPSGQAMRGFPMIAVSGPPGYANDVRFRGLRQGYTQVLVDHEPVPGGSRERQLQVDRLPSTLIDRISLMPIPPAGLPQEGIAGTVDILLREIPDAPETSVLFRAGRVRDAAVGGAALAHGAVSGDWGYLLAGSADSLARWTPQEIETFNATGTLTGRQEEDSESAIEEFNLTPRLRWSRDGFVVRVDPFLLSKEETKDREIDNLNGTGVLTRRDAITEERTHRVGRGKASVTVPAGTGLRVTAGGLWQKSDEDRENTTAQRDPAGVLTAHTRDTLSSGEFRAKGLLHVDADAFPGHRVAAGAEGGKESRRDTSSTLNLMTGLPGTPKPGGNRNDLEGRFATVFLADSITVAEGHVLTPGFRAEWKDLDATDDSGRVSSSRRAEPLPSLHYLWRANDDVSVYASAARLIRWPDFNSLSTVVETSNPNGVNTPDITGDPDLDPERAAALEAGAGWRSSDAWFLGANLFYRRLQGVVERVTSLEGTRWVQRPVNGGDADFYGGTVDARVHLAWIGIEGLWLTLNGTRLESDMVDTNTGKHRQLREMPDWLLNAGLDYRITSLGLIVGTSYSWNSGYDNTEPQDFNNRQAHTREDPTGFLDAYIAWEFDPRLLARLTFQNLTRTDKRRETVVFNADGTVNQVQTREEHSPLAITLSIEVNF